MDVLNKSYQRVHLLKEWLKSHINADHIENALQHNDCNSYKRLLSTVYVCEDTDRCPVSSSSLSCYCDQRELVHTAIERSLSKKGDDKNLLSYGFCLMSPDPFSQRCGVNVENRYPNSAVNRLFYPAWETLLARIGDTFVTYLLEHTSLYMFVTPDCLMQLTGTPLQNLTKSKNESKKMCPKMNVNNDSKTAIVKEAEQSDLKYVEVANTSYEEITEVINETVVTKRSKSNVTDTFQERYPENQQTLNCHQSGTHHMVLNRTRNSVSKEMLRNSKLSSCKFTDNTYDSRQKKKRKYEEITDLRYQDLKRASEVYKMKRRDATEPTDGITMSDIEREDVDIHNVSGRYSEIISRKRKRVEENSNNNDLDNSPPMNAKTKYLRLEKANEDVENIGTTDEGIEESNTHQSLSMLNINAVERTAKSLLKVRQKRRRKGKRKMRTNIQVNDYSFCPYEFQLPLARNNALFSRNPRERLSKSVLLSRLDSTCEGALLLLKEIFCDTKVFTRDQVQVILPDFKSMISELNIPGDCTVPLHSVKSSLNNKNIAQHKGQSGNIIDSTCDLDGNVNTAEHVLGGKDSTSQNTKQIKLEGDKDDVNLESGSDIASTQLLDKQHQHIHVNLESVLEGGVGNKESKKVELLAKRKYEILERRKADLVSETNELDMVRSELEATHSNSDICDKSDIGKSIMSVEGKSSVVNDAGSSSGITVGDSTPILSDATHTCTVPQEKIASMYKTTTEHSTELGPQNRETLIQNTTDIDGSSLSAVIPVVKQFIENHRRCPYRSILNHLCPTVIYKTTTPNTWQSTRHGILRSYGRYNLSKLLSSHHHPRKVYLFLRACLLKVLPVKMMGTKHNLNILLKNISKMVSLGKNDRLMLGQLMNGIKTGEVDWLRGSTSNCVKRHLLARLVLWLFHYILNLLKTYFYITDTGFLRYRLVYYRQATWNRLHILGLKDLIQRKILETVSQKKVLNGLQSKTSLGVSVLRFLPKQQALRPIINMATSMSVDYYCTRSVNKQISDLHCLLTYLKNKNPSLIGHGILGTDGIYKCWKEFVHRWRGYGCPRLYFVKTDICKCYDTISQDKLYDIMANILTTEMNNEEYIIRKYFIMGLKDGNVVRKFQRDVMPLSEFNPHFFSFCQEKAQKHKISNAVFVDKVVYQHETCESLLNILKLHLYNNFVKVGNQYCLQTSGISQGSVISTLLCSFYYADMEKKLLEITDRDLLVRLVDDYMYITPSHDNAVKFLSMMISGFPEYTCSTNKEKMLTNFRWDDDVLPIVSTGMKDTVSVELSTNPGKSLREKILFSIKQKCHKLYIDGHINGRRQVLRNVYLIFLSTVFKLHTHIKYLSIHRREQNNSKFLFGVIKEMINVVMKLVRKYLPHNGKFMSRATDTITWLCLKACSVKLRRHHGQYKHLLKQIKKQLNQKQANISHEEFDEVNAVVGSGMTAEFHSVLP